MGGQPIVMTDRILQNVRVLAVGQSADAKLDKPSVVRAVTIEVDSRGRPEGGARDAARAASRSCCARPARPHPMRLAG